jgi:hypothetical protein
LHAKVFGASVWHRGYAQSFITGPLRRFFRVLPHAPQPGGISDFDSVLARRRHLKPQHTQMSAPRNFVDVTQFLVGERWDDQVQGFKPAELYQLVAAPSTTEPHLLALQQHVLPYLKLVQKLIQRVRSSGLLQTLADTGRSVSANLLSE